jgi:hypothetical protein
MLQNAAFFSAIAESCTGLQRGKLNGHSSCLSPAKDRGNRLAVSTAHRGAAEFGGSVWSPVSCTEAIQFRDARKRRCEQLFPEAAADSEFFVTTPGIAYSAFCQ